MVSGQPHFRLQRCQCGDPNRVDLEAAVFQRTEWFQSLANDVWNRSALSNCREINDGYRRTLACLAVTGDWR